MNFNEIHIEIKYISITLYLDLLEEAYSSIQIHLKVNRNKIENEISYINQNCLNVFN